MIKQGLLLSIGAFALAACATTADEASSSAAAPATAKAEPVAVAATDETKSRLDPDRIICKKMGKTSTRLRKNEICKTKRQWDQEAEALKDDMRQITIQPGAKGD
jgi:ABC-type Fe3+-hydroxamate transport system substrate-binding protein